MDEASKLAANEIGEAEAAADEYLRESKSAGLTSEARCLHALVYEIRALRLTLMFFDREADARTTPKTDLS